MSDPKDFRSPFLDNRKRIFENSIGFVIFDNFPVSEGHSLIIPKRVYPNYFDSTKEEVRGLNELIFQTKDYLDKKFEPNMAKVILPITDPYVVHHGSLGSFATIYLEDKSKVESVVNAIKEIKDIEVVLTKDEGCSTYNLPLDRMGDIICMSSEFMTIGSSEDKHNLSGLNEPLRSHGGLHEREVPFISNLKLPNLDPSKQLYNYDAFYYAINGAL